MSKRPVILATAVLSLAGVMSLLLMTRWGIGTSPDSVHYIQVARHLLGEQGAESLSQHAPFYPLLLAAGGFVGLDPLDGARWLNALLFGLNIFLVGYIVRRSSRNETWFWAAGSLLMLGSAPVLSIHATALTEPLFLLSTLLGFYLLSVYLESSERLVLLIAALAIGLAFFSRYAGAACVIAGAVAVLLFSSKPVYNRIADALLFGFLCCVPMLAWMLRGLTVASTATGRELVFHPINRSHVWQALYTMSGWMLIPGSAPNAVRLVLGVALAVGLAAILVRRGQAARSIPQVIRVLALFITIYGAFLAVSISFFDANTQLDDRILLPALAAGLIVFLYLLDVAWPLARRRPAVAYAIVTLTAVFVTAHLARGVGAVSTSYAGGWGFSSLAWQHSATLDQVRRLPDTVLAYSNAPEVVYLHTGRTVRAIPRKWILMSQQPNQDFPAQLTDARHRLEAECGVVVYFRNLGGQKSMPNERELMTQLSLRVRVEENDGAILSTTACQQ